MIAAAESRRVVPIEGILYIPNGPLPPIVGGRLRNLSGGRSGYRVSIRSRPQVLLHGMRAPILRRAERRSGIRFDAVVHCQISQACIASVITRGRHGKHAGESPQRKSD